LNTPLDSLDRPSGSPYILNGEDDPSGAQETVITDINGDFGPKAVWVIGSSEPPADYDIVADDQGEGTIGTFESSDFILPFLLFNYDMYILQTQSSARFDEIFGHLRIFHELGE